MVFVPAGEFLMGSKGDPLALAHEAPQHTVSLDAFWIDQFEVTNARYRLCIEAKACRPPTQARSALQMNYNGNPAYDDYPVLYVGWTDAKAFCAWAGKRMPTEAEWEKAARGTDGRIWPWGNVFDSSRVNSAESGIGDTSRVGAFPGGASPYGVMDMAGNGEEWVWDLYQADYYRVSPLFNPAGPLTGPPPSEAVGILRGGSWLTGKQSVRAAHRFNYFQRHVWYETTFRCVMQ